MKVVELHLTLLREAPWNSNRMDQAMVSRLRESIKRYGLLGVLVVRRMGELYEVLSGNQRLAVLNDLDYESAPCVVVDLDDAQARLLSQALNHIQGEDDLGLRAELLQEVLGKISEREVLAVLPDSADSLKALSSLGKETIAEHLKAWQQAQAARLKHFIVQLTSSQKDVVEEALSSFLPEVRPGDEGNPNVRGLALYHLCRAHLEDTGRKQ
ncbi:MAG: ParB N-terminal domain-containing protein [Dehalococcoidia bacterium]